MKIALLEVSHWHAPLYLSALERPGIEVVGVSDSERTKGAGIAERFGCPEYGSVEDLLADHRPDFAFAFGRHADMPRVGRMLIERGIPFALEKPCGVHADQVAELRALAEASGVYVAVPLIFRLSDMLETLVGAEGQRPLDLTNYAVRFIVGPPSRYRTGSSWMLDPEISGGGPTINVASHFIDLFRFLSGQEVVAVSAMMSSRNHGERIEDHSVMIMRAADGTLGTIETGYAFPSTQDVQREFSFSIGSRKAYFQSGDDEVTYRIRSDLSSGSQRRPARLNTDDYYPLFVDKVLAEVRAGAKPFAGLKDAEDMMRVIDAAYVSASAGGALQHVHPTSAKV